MYLLCGNHNKKMIIYVLIVIIYLYIRKIGKCVSSLTKIVGARLFLVLSVTTRLKIIFLILLTTLVFRFTIFNVFFLNAIQAIEAFCTIIYDVQKNQIRLYFCLILLSMY